jgi:hypothetical protein
VETKHANKSPHCGGANSKNLAPLVAANAKEFLQWMNRMNIFLDKEPFNGCYLHIHKVLLRVEIGELHESDPERSPA